MKHRIKGRKLNRNSSHRKALFRNLSISLIEHERIKTTLPKAKELRPYIEKLLTLSKVDNLANRRRALSIIANLEAVQKLFENLGKRIENRNGGYTRIYKFGFRTGDKAPMALIELVDQKKEEKKTPKTSKLDKSKDVKKESDKKEVKNSEGKAEKNSEKKEA